MFHCGIFELMSVSCRFRGGNYLPLIEVHTLAATRPLLNANHSECVCVCMNQMVISASITSM